MSIADKCGLDKLIRQWIIDAALPFSAVDCDSFRKMITKANASYAVSTRNTQKTAVLHDMRLYKLEVENILRTYICGVLIDPLID